MNKLYLISAIKSGYNLDYNFTDNHNFIILLRTGNVCKSVIDKSGYRILDSSKSISRFAYMKLRQGYNIIVKEDDFDQKFYINYIRQTEELKDLNYKVEFIETKNPYEYCSLLKKLDNE